VVFLLRCDIRNCRFGGIKFQFESLTKNSKFPEKFKIIQVIQVHVCKQSGKVSFRLGKWFERTVDSNTHL
jgi:putative IMPACT (imprinted ancient) family translation regulator